jgi:hypothetical protein
MAVFLSAPKDGLAIEAKRHWPQGPLQSPLQNVKKGAFWRHFVDGLSGLLIPVRLCLRRLQGFRLSTLVGRQIPNP